MTTVTDFTDGTDVDAFLLNTMVQALLRAILNPAAASVSVTDATEGTTTSTAYTDTLTSASTLSVNFTAPPSGKVVVALGCAIASIPSANSYFAFRLSGASTRAASDTDSVHTAVAQYTPGSRLVLCSGLTAGGAYTATAQHRTSVGTSTAWFRERSIVVMPQWPLA
jgi:hypothetical protein